MALRAAQPGAFGGGRGFQGGARSGHVGAVGGTRGSALRRPGSEGLGLAGAADQVS